MGRRSTRPMPCMMMTGMMILRRGARAMQGGRLFGMRCSDETTEGVRMSDLQWTNGGAEVSRCGVWLEG